MTSIARQARPGRAAGGDIRGTVRISRNDLCFYSFLGLRKDFLYTCYDPGATYLMGGILRLRRVMQEMPLAEILGTSPQNSICEACEFASPDPPCGLPLLATQRLSCHSLPSAGEAVWGRLGWLLADSPPASLLGACLWNHLTLRGFIGHTARLCQREPERILTATVYHSPHSCSTSSMAPCTHAPLLRNGRPPTLGGPNSDSTAADTPLSRRPAAPYSRRLLAELPCLRSTSCACFSTGGMNQQSSAAAADGRKYPTGSWLRPRTPTGAPVRRHPCG
jgi:hypothetical protein